MGKQSEIEKIEEEIWLGELSDDLFYVRGRGRELRRKMRDL